MEFSFIEARESNFAMKEFSVNFFIAFMRFYQYSKSNGSASPITFDSCPAEAVIIWLT